MSRFRAAAGCAVAFLLAGCATTQQQLPPAWLRTDGRPMSGNAALTQQFEIDRTICTGEMQKANASGTVITGGGFAGIVAAQNRSEAVGDVGRGCMAEKGYLRVPGEQAEAMAAQLAATAAQRQQAAPPTPKQR